MAELNDRAYAFAELERFEAHVRAIDDHLACMYHPHPPRVGQQTDSEPIAGAMLAKWRVWKITQVDTHTLAASSETDRQIE